MRYYRPTPWLLAAALLTLAAADPPVPAGADDWKLDVLHRKNGKAVQGIVVEDTPDHVQMRCVSRKAGRPTVVITETFSRSEVDHVELLGDADRDLLRAKLRALAREREQRGIYLRALADVHETPADAVDLRSAPWPPDPRVQALVYHSDHFRLVSTARPEVVRLAAVELELVFAAYARAFPPRNTGIGPTTVLLLPSLSEYQTLVRGRGYNFLNPAYYDATRNEVVCASDLQRLADENERVRHEHDRQRDAIKSSEAELRKVYRDRVPVEQLQPLEEALAKMRATEERNAATLELSRRGLFQRLYHEAFHAYVAACVYPPAEGELPRWLNEGLAQIFETAIVEAGELRVGQADRERYEALRSALKRRDLLPLDVLLRSGSKEFVVAHAAGQQTSDRYYLASRALAFHLAFERHLPGTSRFENYVRALRRNEDPVAAFEELVGEPLPRFEKEHLDYLDRLRSDGTVASARKR